MRRARPILPCSMSFQVELRPILVDSGLGISSRTAAAAAVNFVQDRAPDTR